MEKHFSHRHPLAKSETEEDEGTICSGCELHLSGPSYKCLKPSCEFHLHELCFHLPHKIQHNSHPDHPLTLFSTPPYSDREFSCNGCGDFGSAFIYHCGRCQFDLHIQCATMPETVNSKDHGHPLVLFYCLPNKREEKRFVCDLCGEIVPERCWVLYCGYCDYGIHLNCANVDGDEDDGDGVEDD